MKDFRTLLGKKPPEKNTSEPEQRNAILVELVIWMGLALAVVCAVAGLLLLLWNWVVPTLGGPHLRYGFALGGLLLVLLIRMFLSKQAK
jgi:FtsH-binding integral membrane protein